MNSIRAALIALARFLLAAVFLTGGMYKILHWHSSEQLMMEVLSSWQSNLSASEAAQDLFSWLIHFTPLVLAGEAMLQIIGGLLLMLGVREKFGAALLFIQLLPMTVIYHQFWFMDVINPELQQLLFLKNSAILGGLLMVMLFGAQAPQKNNHALKP